MYGGIGFPPKAEPAQPTGEAFPIRFPQRKFQRISGNRLVPIADERCEADFVRLRQPAFFPMVYFKICSCRMSAFSVISAAMPPSRIT